MQIHDQVEHELARALAASVEAPDLPKSASITWTRSLGHPNWAARSTSPLQPFPPSACFNACLRDSGGDLWNYQRFARDFDDS